MRSKAGAEMAYPKIQKTDDRKQRTDDGWQKTEYR